MNKRSYLKAEPGYWNLLPTLLIFLGLPLSPLIGEEVEHRLPAAEILRELVDTGKLRPALGEDIDAWFDKASEPFLPFNPELRVDVNVEPTLDLPSALPTFVVLEPFDYPETYSPPYGNFIVPTGLELPSGFELLNWIYRMDGSREGLFAENDPPAQTDDSAWERVFGNLPGDFRLYAVSATQRTPNALPEYQLDEEKGLVSRADVIVNQPDGLPVVLVLTGNGDPIVWNVGWTEGTRLAGVIVSGRSQQALVGTPSSVPHLISSFLVPGDFDFFVAHGATRDLLDLNARLRMVGGRDIDFFYFEKENTGRFEVGQPLEAGHPVLYSDDLDLERYRLDATPLYGKAGIRQLISENKIRGATIDDIEAWTREGGVDFDWDDPFFGSGLSLLSTYVVLEQITIPRDLFGSARADFMLPSGVPQPIEESPGHFAVIPVPESIVAVRARLVVNFEDWTKELEKALEAAGKDRSRTDADQDGVADELEFLLGSDPLDPTSQGSPEIKVEKKEALVRVSLSLSLRTNNTGRGLAIESSTDGREWATANSDFEVTETEKLSSDRQQVTLQSRKPLSEDEKKPRLFRVRAVSFLD